MVVIGVSRLSVIVLLVCSVSIFLFMLIFGFLKLFFMYSGECSEMMCKFLLCG